MIFNGENLPTTRSNGIGERVHFVHDRASQDNGLHLGGPVLFANYGTILGTHLGEMNNAAPCQSQEVEATVGLDASNLRRIIMGDASVISASLVLKPSEINHGDTHIPSLVALAVIRDSAILTVEGYAQVGGGLILVGVCGPDQVILTTVLHAYIEEGSTDDADFDLGVIGGLFLHHWVGVDCCPRVLTLENSLPE